jgi:hypothetical protein
LRFTGSVGEKDDWGGDERGLGADFVHEFQTGEGSIEGHLADNQLRWRKARAGERLFHVRCGDDANLGLF